MKKLDLVKKEILDKIKVNINLNNIPFTEIYNTFLSKSFKKGVIKL